MKEVLFGKFDEQWRPSSQCHRAMALVVFLPRPENQGKIWVTSNKKSQSPEVALVDFSPDGRPCKYHIFLVSINNST